MTAKFKPPTRPDGQSTYEYRIEALTALLKTLGPSRIDSIAHAYYENIPDEEDSPCSETVKRTLKIMERRGVAKRCADPTDGRAVLWTPVR